jgi:poly-gamma-glutamate synthesis protein (capsule biosynthesis protein)
MVTLLFSGDFAPLLKPNEILDSHFSDIESLLQGCDLHITNMECPLTLSEKSIVKSGPSIKAHPQNIELLKQANVSVACLANNHIFDFNEKGIIDTIEICKKNSIDCIGIVSRPDGNPHWLIKGVKGKRIGFLNYCEHEFSVRDQGQLGANGYDPIKAFYDIKELRPLIDYLIVIYHGGNEYYPLPSPHLKKTFHYLVDLGADAVIGHHTHVSSGYEIYNGKPLVYSLGNFFFPYKNEPAEWHQALLLKLIINNKIDLELIPINQCLNNQLKVNAAKQNDANTVLEKVNRISDVIKNDEELQIAWSQYTIKRGVGLYKTIMFSNRIERLFFKLGILQDKRKQKARAITLSNIIRCSSLNELLVTFFKNVTNRKI